MVRKKDGWGVNNILKSIFKEQAFQGIFSPWSIDGIKVEIHREGWQFYSHFEISSVARYNATIRFLLFLFFLFFRESFASFTRGTRGIPCKVQPPSLDPCEVSEAKSRGEWSRKELSDCRHLRDGLSLINGSNIPPYTDDPGIGDTILVIYKHRSLYVCVRVRVRGGCFCFYSIRNRRKQELSIVELAQIFDLPGNCNFTTIPPSLVYHFLSTVSVDSAFDSE